MPRVKINILPVALVAAAACSPSAPVGGGGGGGTEDAESDGFPDEESVGAAELSPSS